MSYSEIELLAPAGKWGVMEAVVKAGADAVYLGGKQFNMRMLRPEYNFSEQELRDAVNYLHEKGKKLYITLNNLYFDHEITGIKEYMLFLQDIMVDALIIQDMGIIPIYDELGVDIPLHASVQMGISNSGAIKALEDIGFKRVILSKNVSLQEIAKIKQETNMGLEYFVHGDMCIAHTGKCYMSSFLAGKSGNRGECIKPCRWQYSLDGEEYKYYLAHNDLCLYQYLQEMIEKGIISFKIEGRMRSAEYLTNIVEVYRQAIDAIATDPKNYNVDEDGLQQLYRTRERDLSTGSLFGRIGFDAIGITGAREPLFPTSPVKLDRLLSADYREIEGNINDMPHLSVKIGDIDVIANLCTSGVDQIILGLEGFRQNRTCWDVNNLKKALELSRESGLEILLETPHIVKDDNIELAAVLQDKFILDEIKGIIINDLGSYHLLRDSKKDLYGGPGLNITNSYAARYFKQLGLQRLTLSPEIYFEQLEGVLKNHPDSEVLIHGSLCGLVTDFCLARSLNGEEFDDCSISCLHGEQFLIDQHGQKYAIRTDYQCRNYLYFPHDLCLFPYLPELTFAGVCNMKIDIQHYDSELGWQIVKIYKQALQSLTKKEWKQLQNYKRLLKMFPKGLTARPLFTKN